VHWHGQQEPSSSPLMVCIPTVQPSLEALAQLLAVARTLASFSLPGNWKGDTRVVSLTNTVSVLGFYCTVSNTGIVQHVGCPQSTGVNTISTKTDTMVGGAAVLNMLGGCSTIMTPMFVHSMSIARFQPIVCISGCPILLWTYQKIVDCCNLTVGIDKGKMMHGVLLGHNFGLHFNGCR
jgi:hypothetical protein